MKAQNIQKCPHCGQSANKREITLYKGMVDALARVYKWCSEKRRWDNIRFRDFAHLLGPNEMARFSDWPTFDSKMVGNEKRKYVFNEKLIAEYLANRRKVPSLILRDPLRRPTDEAFEEKYAKEISPLYEFMDEDEYVAKYEGTANLGGPRLF